MTSNFRVSGRGESALKVCEAMAGTYDSGYADPDWVMVTAPEWSLTTRGLSKSVWTGSAEAAIDIIGVPLPIASDLDPFLTQIAAPVPLDGAAMDLKAQVSKLKEDVLKANIAEADLKAQVAAMQQASLTAPVASLQQGVAKQQITPPATASLTIYNTLPRTQSFLFVGSNIYTRPELVAMKNKDRKQGGTAEKDGYGGRWWYRGGRDSAGKPHGLGRRDFDNGEYGIGEHDHGRQCGHWIWYNKNGSINREWAY